MDAKRIDAVIHSVAIATSRRVALGAFAVGMANLLTRREGDDAAAKKRRKRNKKCPGGKTRCGKACVNLAASSAHCGQCGIACPFGVCLDGFCDCFNPEDCSSLNGCVCALVTSGETVCAGALTTTTCQNNDDCPPRSVCRQALAGNFCGEPCPG